MIEKLEKWFKASIWDNGFIESVNLVKKYEVKNGLIADYAIFVKNHLVGYCIEDKNLELPPVSSTMNNSEGTFNSYIFKRYLNPWKERNRTSFIPDEFKDVVDLIGAINEQIRPELILMLYNNKSLIAVSSKTVMAFDFRIDNYESFNDYFRSYLRCQFDNVRKLPQKEPEGKYYFKFP